LPLLKKICPTILAGTRRAVKPADYVSLWIRGGDSAAWLVNTAAKTFLRGFTPWSPVFCNPLLQEKVDWSFVPTWVRAEIIAPCPVFRIPDNSKGL